MVWGDQEEDGVRLSWRAIFKSVEVRDPDRRCRHCEYSLEGLGRGGGVKCPECGNPVSDDDLLGVRRVAAMPTAEVMTMPRLCSFARSLRLIMRNR